MQYMELLPEEMRPVAGTEGALYRRRQLMRQLPAYDQDPSQCHSLSEAEVKAMAQFVKSYKEEALGVGEVALPGEGGMPKDNGAKPKNEKEQPNPEPTTNGTVEENGKKSEYVSLTDILTHVHIYSVFFFFLLCHVGGKKIKASS